MKDILFILSVMFLMAMASAPAPTCKNIPMFNTDIENKVLTDCTKDCASRNVVSTNCVPDCQEFTKWGIQYGGDK